MDKIEALAKLCLAQEKKFSKLRPYLILLKQEAQKELDTHRDILLYETLTRIVRGQSLNKGITTNLNLY